MEIARLFLASITLLIEAVRSPLRSRHFVRTTCAGIRRFSALNSHLTFGAHSPMIKSAIEMAYDMIMTWIAIKPPTLWPVYFNLIYRSIRARTL